MLSHNTLLNLLGRLAADSGRVSKGAQVGGALRRLSTALSRGNDFPVPGASTLQRDAVAGHV